MIPAEVYVIVRHEIPHPARPVFLLCLHSIDGIGHITLCHRISEYPLLFLRIIETESGADVEPLERSQIHINVTKQAPVFVTVVFVPDKPCQRVLPVRVTGNRASKIPCGGIDRQRRIGLQHILQETAGSLHLVGAVHGEVLTDCKNILDRLEFSIDTRGKAFKIGIFQYAEVFVIAD